VEALSISCPNSTAFAGAAPKIVTKAKAKTKVIFFMGPQRLQLDTHDTNLTPRQSTTSPCQPNPNLSLGRGSLKEASRVQH
jgi:hypothetical protein